MSLPPIPTSEIGLDFSTPESFASTSSSSSTSAASTPSSPTPAHHVLLPIPALNNSNSFTQQESEPLPPDIANADISIAPDGSFVETSSGPAARELKKRFDQHYGVGPSVRSPYVITSFVNQHGKEMYRIGHRDQPAPGASAAQAEDLVSSRSSKSPTTSPQHIKRSSRLSINAFFNPSSSSHHQSTPGPRKLKKPRSNPDLTSPSHSSHSSRHHHGSSYMGGRMHSLSVTAADMPRSNNNANYNNKNNNSHVHHAHHGDAFGDVMGFTSSSASSSISSATGHSGLPTFIKYPFGPGVLFDSPGPFPSFSSSTTRSGNSSNAGSGTDSGSLAPHLPIPRSLRVVQSFESGLTAKQDDEKKKDKGKGKGKRTDAFYDGDDDDDDNDSLDLDDEDHDLGRPPSAIHLRESYLLAGIKGKGKEKEKQEEREQLPTVPDSEAPSAPEPQGVQAEVVDSSNFPLPETSLHSRYNTDIFDVLQTYRGLPLLDRLSDSDSDSGSELDGTREKRRLRGRRSDFGFGTTVIKMSLSSENNAAPKDDPRFVIWGEVVPVGDEAYESQSQSYSHSHSHGSRSASRSQSVESLDLTGSSSSRSGTDGVGRRKSSAKDKDKKAKSKSKSISPDTPTRHHPRRPSYNPSSSSHLHDSYYQDPSERQKVLVAATIERWIAQLTSDLNYDELLNFFLTYRTYISASDLAHLLIARFHWALQRPVSTSTTTAKANSNTNKDSDDLVRRIVRVRTFVAWRYWLLTFFTVDFVPNRELRLLVASWLNTLGRDPVLERCKDGASIVKKLKKVAKDCIKAHTRTPPKPKVPKPPRPLSSSVTSSAEPTSSSSTSTSPTESQPQPPKELLLGEKFAEATRKLREAQQSRSKNSYTQDPFDTDSDSDLDLDFAMDGYEGSSPTVVVPSQHYNGGGADPGMPGSPISINGSGFGFTMGPIHLGGTSISPSGPNSIAVSNLPILQRTDHAPGPDQETGGGVGQGGVGTGGSMGMGGGGQGYGYGHGVLGHGGGGGSVPLPIHHSALSRAFVKTIGRLGRWKRVLNSRTVFPGAGVGGVSGGSTGGGAGGVAGRYGGGGYLGPCSGVSAFDLELTVSRDLLTVNGGVESYLRMIEQNQGVYREEPTVQAAKAPVVQTQTPSQASDDGGSSSPVVPPGLVKPEAEQDNSDTVSEAPVPDGPPPDYSESIHDGSTDSHISEPIATTTVHQVESSPEMDRASLARSTRSSTSTDSFGEPLSASRSSAAFPGFRPPWQFDVVSIDELDLSDNSSEHGVSGGGGIDGPAIPPGLKRPPRRLPLRRDFEFLDRRDTVSSMGIISRDSVASEASSAASSSNSIGLGGGIHQWQMNALVDSLDDDDETGDVEDALKRLEGQISPQKRQEKASKVDGWVKTIRERLAAGDYSDEAPRFSDDGSDDEEDERSSFSSAADEASEHTERQTIPAISEPEPEGSDGGLDMDNVSTPIVTQAPPSHLASPPRSADAKPAPEDVVPLEILQSRLSEMPPLSTRLASITSKFADHDVPRAHRSFILGFKADDLAQHFAMIDRELFMNIKFDELLLDDWAACEEVNVLDWAQYLKDRARWKAESRWPEKTSALGCVRGRFNLMVNFVVSEIVLTPPPERPLVFARFLRIAWKAYQRSSFNTLVAIITGLQGEWVTRAMKKGLNKLTLWESRMFADFKVYISNVDNFKYIRRAVDAIADAKPLNSNTHAASVVSGGGEPSGKGKSSLDKPIVPACIPFIGIYLSQLNQYNQLTPLIDPTAPNKAIGFDPVSSNFEPVAHPEVFSTLAPLPSSMNLEPLINVHKQRLIAGVIKSLVAGQHLASRVQFPVDKKLFHKCLRLRGLDSETLQRVLHMLPD
ncbi:Guanine nucleotide exchange factor lte1 [Stygiomarasmius scandens]|uniref:Guanine nucleotide exchange factor lte1 n=1 Tax=Marasmiellus scandens TaxID=2682957 RepID=A0ABR1J4C8_9AGAR